MARKRRNRAQALPPTMMAAGPSPLGGTVPLLMSPDMGDDADPMAAQMAAMGLVPPGLLREEAPEPDDPVELLTIGKRASSHWLPCHRRQAEDLMFVRNQWIEQMESDKQEIADPEIASDTTLAITLRKYVDILSGARRILSMKPRRPSQKDLVQRAEDAWRYFEDEIQDAYATSGRTSFYREEAHLLCLRGWICQRVILDDGALQSGEFPFIVENADPITISPVFGGGPDDLRYVVQEYRALKHELLSQFPEFDLMGVQTFDKAGLFDELDVTVIYSDHYAYYYLSDAHMKTVKHDYGKVPWIILAPNGPVLATGMATSAGRSLTATGLLGTPITTGYARTTTRDVGVSVFHDIIGPVRTRIRTMSQIATAAEQDVDPPVAKTGNDPTAIEVDLNPGGETNLMPDQKIEIMGGPRKLDYLNTMLQGLSNNIALGSLHPMAWGQPGNLNSGLERGQATHAMYDSLTPYADGLALAQCLRWKLAMHILARHGLYTQPFGFPTATGGNDEQSEWGEFTPDDFEVLRKAKCEVEFRDMVPGEMAGKVALAGQIKQAALLSTEEILGEYLQRPNPRDSIEKLRVEQMEQEPSIQIGLGMLAMQNQEPAFWQQFGQFLQAQFQRRAMESLAPPQPPQPPVQPGGGMNPSGPPSLSAAPGGGGGAGAPPPGQPPPLPYNVPGLNAMAAGQGGIPGGLHTGLPTSVITPYALGQVQTPQAEPPEVAYQRRLAALLHSGQLPAR